MKLIVGLGNPGAKYKNNRHNVGHMFISYLISELTSSRVNGLTEQKNSNSQNSLNPLIKNKKIILEKTSVFMNQSGLEIRKFIENWKLLAPRSSKSEVGKIGNLIVVHDDLDIPLGKFKIVKGVGPKLHNGLESIENTLGTKDFTRIRIGIDNRTPDKWIDGETYVLSNFAKEELQVLTEKVFPEIKNRLISRPIT